MTGASRDRTGLHYRLLRRLSARLPRITRLAGAASDGIVRATIGPQIPVPQPARTYTTERLEALTDQLNQSADRYFADQATPEFIEFLLTKPYSDIEHFPKYFFNIGAIFHWLRLRPDDVVLELGCGSGWLSHFMNRFGCRTISADVSATAVNLARRLFDENSTTDWSRDPQFISYDGHRLPIDDGSVDRIVVYDAFHHVPNQREVLGEMARVLRDGGMVALSEPGRRHSLSEMSVREVEDTGVLENDIVVEELAALARGCGFSRATVVPVNLASSVEVEADELVSFLRGKGFHRYWIRHSQALLNEHLILLYKGSYRPDSRRPSVTTATIEAPGSLMVGAGAAPVLACTVTNTGDTVWRTDAASLYGNTRVGVQLTDADGVVIDKDWCRIALPHDVAPGQTVDVERDLPPIDHPRSRRLLLDMVAEQVRWFADRGSPTAIVRLDSD